MSDSESAAYAAASDADRIVRLEKVVADLGARLAKHTEATLFSLRNLKRDIGSISRTIAQRPSHD